jgi:hypothetical protein
MRVKFLSIEIEEMEKRSRRRIRDLVALQRVPTGVNRDSQGAPAVRV